MTLATYVLESTDTENIHVNGRLITTRAGHVLVMR